MRNSARSASRRVTLSLAVAAAATAALAGIAIAAPGDIAPSLVSNINPGSTSSNPEDLVNVGGTLFFSATEADHGRELWRSDGTPGGTTRITDINPGSGDSTSAPAPRLVNVAGTLFFPATDGTDAELYKLEPPYTGPPTEIEINTGGSSSPQDLANFNGTLFFAATDGSTAGRELWKSNGGPVGPGGTEMVANINTTMDGSSFPERLTQVGNTLFFVATDGGDGVDGRELWKSNGTVGDATQLEINAATDEGSDPLELTNANGTLFLAAEDDGTVGRELWKAGESDTAATAIDIVSGPPGSDLGDFGALGATLFFRADDGTHGEELWKSNGGPVGPGGTEMVADINTTPTIGADSFPEELFAFNGKIFFNADDGSSGQELWKSNGGPLGTGNTERVADINPGAPSSIGEMGAVFDGALWFRAVSAAGGDELWKTDGTTVRTADIRPGPLGSGPGHFTAGNGALFFSADDGTSNGRELWKATIEGPGPPSAPPLSVTAPTQVVNPLCAPLRKKLKKAKTKAKKKKIRGKLRKLGC